MEVTIYDTSEAMAKAAASKAAHELRDCIDKKGRATFLAATGQSQVKFVEALTQESGVDWSKTIMYHLDEYVGLPESHRASFRRYLKERLLDRVAPGTVHFIDGNAADVEAECARLGGLLAQDGIDVAFVGIGENGHLAFNDPPADFENPDLFTVVELTESCRAQQVHEGWFESVSEVPPKAVTITIAGILKSRSIICTVPEARKASAVKRALTGSIAPSCPASVLQRHANTYLFLDKDAARLLDEGWVKEHKASPV
ncbi:MAG: glucosamine-6-phosphate deaminase [Candidatus Hydrogenedentes bacterium]|nr:glucosamine-6-phosphate deaminase [Candidatus Hydrogenedentota bacterium]